MQKSSQEFRKLVTAALVSQVGSHFLTLALAAYILSQTGSAVQASLVFVFSYVPPAILGRWVGPLVEKKTSKKFLIVTDLCAALISAACGYCVIAELPLPFFITLVSIRSIFSMMQRSALMKWIKGCTPSGQQARAFQTFLLAFFISTAISGVLAAVTLSWWGIRGTVIFDVVTYLVAIGLFTLLQDLSFSTPSGSQKNVETMTIKHETFKHVLQRCPLIGFAFMTVVLSQALFQGAYSVLVTYLPFEVFKMGTAGTGYFQLAASFGIIAGWYGCRRLPTMIFGQRIRLSAFIVLFFVAGASVYFTIQVSLIPASLGLFFLLNAGFEMLWLSASSFGFAQVPQHLTARFQYWQASIAAVTMSVVTYLYAVGADQLLLGPVVAWALAIGAGIWLIAYLNFNKKAARPDDAAII